RANVGDAEVDHEGGFARGEVRGVGGERAPHRRVRVASVEHGAAPWLDVDPQVIAVPRAERCRIACLEEDAADAEDALHAATVPGGLTRSPHDWLGDEAPSPTYLRG
ncbi:MAG: hypothetical protein ACK55I_48390, partial [bacterium]